MVPAVVGGQEEVVETWVAPEAETVAAATETGVSLLHKRSRHDADPGCTTCQRRRHWSELMVEHEATRWVGSRDELRASSESVTKRTCRADMRRQNHCGS